MGKLATILSIAALCGATFSGYKAYQSYKYYKERHMLVEEIQAVCSSGDNIKCTKLLLKLLELGDI